MMFKMTTSSLSRSNSSYTSSSNRKNPLVCIWIVAMSLFLSVSFILTPPDDSDGSGLDNLLSYSQQQQQQRGRDDTGYNKVNNENDTSNSVDNNHDKPMSTLKKKSKPSSTSTSSRTTTFVECSIITPFSKLPKDETANGKITIAVYHYNDIPDNNHNNDDAEYFLQLVRLGYYDGLYFFRVIKNFVAQFGYDHLHTLQDKDKPKRIIKKKEKKVGEDQSQQSSSSLSAKNQQQLLSNVRGTVTLVGGNTGQVFINTGNNSRLDKEGSIPFGEIISNEDDFEGQSQQQSMMTQVVDKIYTGYKPGSGQIKVLKDSKNVEIEIQKQFPNMSKIEYCRIL